MKLEGSLPCSLEPANSEVLCNISWHAVSLRRGVSGPSPNPQAGGSPLAWCPRLLIQYLRSYRPYLEAISSIPDMLINLDTTNFKAVPSLNGWETEVKQEYIMILIQIKKNKVRHFLCNHDQTCGITE